MKIPTQDIHEVNIEGKVVLLKESSLLPPYRSLKYRLVRATGGFGCSPNTIGRAVFTEGLIVPDRERWDRSDIEGWIPEEEAAKLIAEKSWEALTAPAPSRMPSPEDILAEIRARQKKHAAKRKAAGLVD